MTTIREVLRAAVDELRHASTPYLDALVLLEWSSSVDRALLLAEQHSATEALFDDTVLKRFQTAVSERARGRPVAAIVGEKEFYGRSFVVGPGVLIPRPDTEVVVERAVAAVRSVVEGAASTRPLNEPPLTILDCCTGSGVIGISVALEVAEHRPGGLDSVELSLSDIDETALGYARRNADRLIGRTNEVITTSVFHADLCRPVTANASGRGRGRDEYYVITANPPYLTDAETRSVLAEGWDEPPAALAAGDDGMTILKEIVPQAFSYLRLGGYLVVEHGFDQGRSVASLFRRSGFVEVATRRDLEGRDRCTEGIKPI